MNYLTTEELGKKLKEFNSPGAAEALPIMEALKPTAKPEQSGMSAELIQALMPAISTLGGYLVGGVEGGAAGAKAGQQSSEQFSLFRKMQQAKDEQEREKKMEGAKLYGQYGIKIGEKGEPTFDPESMAAKKAQAEMDLSRMWKTSQMTEAEKKALRDQEALDLKKKQLDAELSQKGFIKDPESGELKFDIETFKKIKGAGKTGGSGPKISRDAATLRKEFTQSKAVKDLKDVKVQFSKIEKAASNPSAAGDLSLIFSYMKMLDPGSTVREGEFANAQNAAGVPDQIRNMFNKAKSGERLNPKQRADFVNQARNALQSQQDAYDAAVAEYSGYSQLYGVDPKLVIGAEQPVKQKTAPTTQQLSPQAETRIINGATYKKTDKGWVKQ